VAQIAASIGPRTRAIMPVSLYGQVADMARSTPGGAPRPGGHRGRRAELRRAVPGRRSCALSTFGATSFFPSKPLGCYGDGGALFTDDDTWRRRRARSACTARASATTTPGWAWAAAWTRCSARCVLAKLERFEWELRRRAEIGERYARGLRAIDGVEPVAVRADRNSVLGPAVTVQRGSPRRGGRRC
jgi:UDP-2-acetamido-2-deoxy-ribo-hexuluronate aminotransferase